METAIRWSPGPSQDQHRFVLVDVTGNSISLHGCDKSNTSGDHLNTKVLARYDKTPNFNAFDWSKHDSSLIALGLASGDASLIRIQPDDKLIKPLRVFPIKTQRKCNSINFNKTGLLAVGLDRVRNDHCLTIHDVNEGKEPLTRLCTGEAVSSVRFFPGHPSELIAAVARTSLRLFDLRASTNASGSTGPTVFTKQVNNIAIDPVDDNYFTSAGLAGDPCVSVWDKRWLSKAASNQSQETSATQALLDIRPAVDSAPSASGSASGTTNTAIWSVRFSGLKRGRFCVLSSDHELKLYDIATHTAGPAVKLKPASQLSTPSVYGGFPWSSATYVAKTHRLQNPLREQSLDTPSDAANANPALAFDWVTAGEASSQAMLAVLPSRHIAMLHAPRVNQARITPRGHLSLLRPNGLLELLEPGSGDYHHVDTHDHVTIQQSKPSSVLSVKTKGSDNGAEPTKATRPIATLPHHPSTSTARRTDEWLRGDTEPEQSGAVLLTDAKTVAQEMLYENNVHAQRCRNGYRLDPITNIAIIQDNQTLLKLWLIVRRLDHLAHNIGMSTDTLDLSYLGVYAIWNSMENETRNRLRSDDQMSPTLFAEASRDLVDSHGLPRSTMESLSSADRRLLCLEMCGWCFTREALENKCSDLLNQQLYYRAVAVAIWQGHADLAFLILRNMARTKVMSDTGLGALLAAETLNREQWEMAEWMQEEATDPYLKSLLVHVRLRDWAMVVKDTSLTLSDRISVALRYLADDELHIVIKDLTATCIKEGDVNGILMTGLDSTSMDLLQNFITQTDDIQTAVLVSAFTNPLYVSDVRWDMWKDSYLWHMQIWCAFVERTKFLVEHSRRAVTYSGERLIKPRPRQITLRCVHCNGSLADQQPTSVDQETKPASVSSTNTAGVGIRGPSGPPQRIKSSGTVCPRCGRHLPRCVICMRWLGTPEGGLFNNIDGTQAAGQLPKESRDEQQYQQGTTSHLQAVSGTMVVDKDLLGRFVTFCASCGHGFHAHHAMQWFAKHGMCPVPDCQCLCGLRA